jgi:hypothetical protein
MRIVMVAEAREGTMLVIYVAAHVHISIDSDRAVVLQLDGTTGAMNKPKLPDRRSRW